MYSPSHQAKARAELLPHHATPAIETRSHELFSKSDTCAYERARYGIPFARWDFRYADRQRERESERGTAIGSVATVPEIPVPPTPKIRFVFCTSFAALSPSSIESPIRTTPTTTTNANTSFCVLRHITYRRYVYSILWGSRYTMMMYHHISRIHSSHGQPGFVRRQVPTAPLYAQSGARARAVHNARDRFTTASHIHTFTHTHTNVW